MKKNVFKIGFSILIIAMIITMIGCSKKPVETPAPPTGTGNSAEEGDIIVDPEPEGEVVRVTLYYVNEEYVTTGRDTLKKVLSLEKEVTVGEKSLEAVILAEIQKKPEGDKLSTALENIKILSVDTAEKIAYVNLAGDRLSGGSLQEDLVLHQIVYSLTELKDIDAVQLLVDGSKRETLMGHIFIEEPLKRQDLGY
ncbi:Sporulation and spore germination [Anaerovirgula multivorans]|uniref:Sporulation and spore germination n=1 Tax=Anaerovirgula multivorans TaxID=312168 RepID=A0A239EXR7_9FIRM|nr:GerMN domain-containing protein [Anaerovirgula multivorans]SNS49550.1 Sporulation and spore germination [Anaerovirgula multivorans]